MRIVIDTNVLLSALLWRGTPHALLDHVRAGTLELMMSPALMDEMKRVVRYPKFSDILSRTTRTPDGVFTALQSLAETMAAPPLSRPVCRDPDDDAVLACALAAQANLIVSGDDDLLVLKTFEGIPIVTAAEALAMIEAR